MTPTLIETETEPGERTWSITAVLAYLACPEQWARRYGPLRPDERPDMVSPVEQLRGKVLHAAISAAMKAARDDTWQGMPGKMIQYKPAARLALGKAWDKYRMPSDPHEAASCTGMLYALLESLSIPRDIYAIEQRLIVRTDTGLPIIVVPDYAEWIEPGHLLVVDWKTGNVTLDMVKNSAQLRLYAMVLAALDPRVRRVSIALHSIRGRQRFTLEITDPDALVATLSMIERVAGTAEADTELRGRIGPQCENCPVRRDCSTRAALNMPMVTERAS